MIQQRIPTVYLAGPDLFLPDANDRYATLEAVCAAHRLRAQRPFDGEAALHKATSRGGAAQRIFDGNMALLRAADAVLGNMMPFRGECEPDSGTVFEVGVAIALGKPVALYLPQGLVDSGERVRRLFGESAGRDGRYHALIVAPDRLGNFGSSYLLSVKKVI